MKESDECKVGEALNTDYLEGHGIIIAKSPRYDCSENYYRNEICVYNVSMSCAEKSHVDISVQGSHIDLEDGDFLNIFSHSNNQKFPPISGNSLLPAQVSIPETDFVMVFTSNADSRQGKGFKLQLECPTIKESTENKMEIEVLESEELTSGEEE